MTTDDRILAYLSRYGPTDFFSLALALWMTPPTVQRAITRLRAAGKVGEVGGKVRRVAMVEKQQEEK